MNPTTTAIETAVRNAARDAAKYALDQMASGLWTILKADDTEHPGYALTVDADGITCTCEYWAHNGVCKHEKILADELSIRAEEDAHEAMCEAAAFMASCREEAYTDSRADLEPVW